MVMQQQESVSMSVTHTTSADHEDIPDLGCHLGPQRCPRAVQSRFHPSLVQHSENEHCTSSAHQSRAGPDVVGGGEPFPRTGDQESSPSPWLAAALRESSPSPLLAAALSELARAMLKMP